AAAACGLDAYHSCEQLGKAGRAAFGEGESMQSWLDEARGKMIADGYGGVCEAIAALGAEPETAARLGGTAGEVLNYFAGQQGRLGYAVRLRRGQAIGSGLVEGTIKQLLNKRLKQTGARWKVGHVGPLVELGALAAGPEWQVFWDRN